MWGCGEAYVGRWGGMWGCGEAYVGMWGGICGNMGRHMWGCGDVGRHMWGYGEAYVGIWGGICGDGDEAYVGREAYVGCQCIHVWMIVCAYKHVLVFIA